MRDYELSKGVPHKVTPVLRRLEVLDDESETEQVQEPNNQAEHEQGDVYLIERVRYGDTPSKGEDGGDESRVLDTDLTVPGS